MPVMPGYSTEDRIIDFRHLFSFLDFPFMRIDLHDLAVAVINPKSKSWIEIPLTDIAPDRRSACAAALRGLIAKAEIPDSIVKTISDSNLLSNTFKASDNLARALAQNDPIRSVSEPEGRLRWEEETPWPAAYASLFDQLVNVVHLHRAAITKQIEDEAERLAKGGYDPEGTVVLDHTSRVMPTHLHYAFASLGVWLGGGANLQYLSIFGTAPQRRDPAVNIQYAKSIGYDDAESQELGDSGLIAVPASIMMRTLHMQEQLTENPPVFGAIPVDEWNVANLPMKHVLDEDKVERPIKYAGFIYDKYYRAPFRARSLESHGLYGDNNVFRDHYKEYYKNLEPISTLRCKHYCVPVISVSGLDALRDHLSAVPRRGKGGVTLRGQSRLYQLRRSPKVKRLLFGGSCSVEPSLPTAAARIGFDYDRLHFALRHFIEQRLLSPSRADAPFDEARYRRWRDKAASPRCEIDYAVMALAQHYGLPSHGLDVTTSPEVAAFFATNRLITENGISRYQRLEPSDWPEDDEQWPCIFAYQPVTTSLGRSLQDCEEFTDFGLRAQRPSAQHAMFFHGGHSDHQNRLAEAVVSAFRLAPGDYRTSLDFDDLFPSPADDPAYAAMLDFASDPEFAAYGAHLVARYHP